MMGNPGSGTRRLAARGATAGTTGGTNPARNGRRGNPTSGWMSEMPGHVRQGSVPAQQQEQDTGGFEFHVQGTGGDVSPLR